MVDFIAGKETELVFRNPHKKPAVGSAQKRKTRSETPGGFPVLLAQGETRTVVRYGLRSHSRASEAHMRPRQAGDRHICLSLLGGLLGRLMRRAHRASVADRDRRSTPSDV